MGAESHLTLADVMGTDYYPEGSRELPLPAIAYAFMIPEDLRRVYQKGLNLGLALA